MGKVVAVILTYNRKELLEKALAAVYAQTRPCDGVIVVDNASEDGTRQMLNESAYPGLKAYVLSANIGAAGGFNAGFRLAYQNGADFVWMMDDDVFPEPDALQRLLDADEFLAQKGVEHSYLLSTAYTEHSQVTNTPEVSQLTNEVGYGNWPALVEHGLIPIQRATFVSILVPRPVLTRHGLPIASMFIWGEDYEYTLRISRKRPGFLVGNSRVQHVRQKSGAQNLLKEENPSRLKFHRHHVRNNIFIARKYFSTRKLLGVIWFSLKTLSKLLRRAELAKSKVLVHGMIEGLSFYPAEESVNSPFDSLKVKALPVESLFSQRQSPPDFDRAMPPVIESLQGNCS